MNQIIALKILNIEFDFDGEDMSFDEQQQITHKVIGSEISVVNDDPDKPLRNLPAMSSVIGRVTVFMT